MENKIRMFCIEGARNKCLARIALYRIGGEKSAKVINIPTIVVTDQLSAILTCSS
jgi:hypothetical protein